MERSVTSGTPTDGRESQSSGLRSSRISSRNFGNGTIFSRVAYNQWFQNITMVVIVINALWIGMDTQWNHKNIIKDKGEDADLPWYPFSYVVECIFCTYFTIEVLIRFFGYRYYCDCLRDAWFVFDSILVSFMVLETWILKIIEVLSDGGGGLSFLSNFSALRLLRLLRLTRMARLMRFVPELMTIVKGMLSALKSVFFILLFLMCVTYVFAICFTSMFGKPVVEPFVFGEDPTAEQMFQTIGDSMMTLITIGILGDNLAPVTDAILVEGEIYFWLFMIFFMISCLTLLNMMIAVLCEVISSTAKDEEDTRQINLLKMCISDAFDQIDLNKDGFVSEAEWAHIKENKSVRETLLSFGIEEGNLDNCLMQMQASLFHQSKADRVMPMNKGPEAEENPEKEKAGLPLEELVEKVSELRPDVPASCLELSLLQSKLTAEKAQISKRISRAEQLLSKMIQKLGQSGRLSGVHCLETSDESGLLPLKVAPAPPDSSSTVETKKVVATGGLREVPTELLLHVLKMRSPTPSSVENQSAPLKSVSMSPGHATYTCLQQISTDVRAARAG